MASVNRAEAAKALIERLAEYQFQDDERLIEAIDTTGLRIPQSNQRLALLGDAVLKHVLLDAWYPTGTPKGDGFGIVSSVGSNANLAAVARKHGVQDLVITHPGHQGPVSSSILATALEALIGALYLDCGKDMAIVKTFMVGLGLKS